VKERERELLDELIFEKKGGLLLFTHPHTHTHIPTFKAMLHDPYYRQQA
jgi:hypothetical protein